MQHAFNFPLQLGTHSRDEPMKDAARYDVDVMKGDIVVLGSDGLMDNLVCPACPPCPFWHSEIDVGQRLIPV